MDILLGILEMKTTMEEKMDEKQKIINILIGAFLILVLIIAVGNEYDTEELKLQVAISDSLQYEMAEQLADIAVTIAKYESYIALYGRGDTDIWVSQSDSLMVASTLIENDLSWMWWMVWILVAFFFTGLVLFWWGSCRLNDIYDEQTEEGLQEFAGQDK